MNKRLQLINMLNESQDDWKPLVLGFDGQLDPTYLEYKRLRHQLGLDKHELSLFPEGGDVEDEGDLADQNRAMWREFIEKHKNDDLLTL